MAQGGKLCVQAREEFVARLRQCGRTGGRQQDEGFQRAFAVVQLQLFGMRGEPVAKRGVFAPGAAAGGEEFVALLPNTSESVALDVIRRVLANIVATPMAAAVAPVAVRRSHSVALPVARFTAMVSPVKSAALQSRMAVLASAV